MTNSMVAKRTALQQMLAQLYPDVKLSKDGMALLAAKIEALDNRCKQRKLDIMVTGFQRHL